MKPNTAVLKMDPYKPPSSGRQGYLRLDFNENTVGCSPRVVQALNRAINREMLATYPEYESCRVEIAAAFGCSAEETLLTNGTDDAILLLINTFIEPGQRVIVAEPCFAMYRFYASLVGAKVVMAPRGPKFEFPAAAVRAEVEKGARAVLIDNPNNPTGTIASPQVIEGLARDFPDTLVLVDEAYYDFYGHTALPLRLKYPNLVVTRTFSKAHGLAAMRVGCGASAQGALAIQRQRAGAGGRAGGVTRRQVRHELRSKHQSRAQVFRKRVEASGNRVHPERRKLRAGSLCGQGRSRKEWTARSRYPGARP